MMRKSLLLDNNIFKC